MTSSTTDGTTSDGRMLLLASGVRIRRDDGQVLVVQHHSGVAAGRWSVPFTRVAEDEVAEAAALRVLRDQLHLDPGALDFAETISIPGADGDTVVNVFDVAGWAGEPRFSARDFDDAGWVDPSNVGTVDVVPEVAAWLSGSGPKTDVHAALEKELVISRQGLLDMYERIPLRARERPLDGEWAPVDVLHHCAAREAYTIGEAARLAEISGHLWREFNSEQAEVERRLQRRPSDDEVRAQLLQTHDETLRTVQRLTSEQLLHYGLHASRGVVQVRAQIETIAEHDREHVRQLHEMQTAAARG